MENKVFTTVLILVIAVLVGLSIVSRQEKSPLINQMLVNQSEMLSALKDMKSNEGQNQNSILLARLNSLEARFNALERKVNSAPTPAPQAAQRQAPPQPDPNIVHQIPIADTPLVGPKNAKVTIVEFIDFECPFCARFHPPIEEALNAFPNDVNYLGKHFPLNFHPNAKPASKAALAAGEQGKYREMVKGLLENGRNLNLDTFKKIAGDIGLNVSKFEADLKNNDAKYEKIILNDMQLASKVGVRGTPTFYINGKITSARDFSALKAQIEAILNGS